MTNSPMTNTQRMPNDVGVAGTGYLVIGHSDIHWSLNSILTPLSPPPTSFASPDSVRLRIHSTSQFYETFAQSHTEAARLRSWFFFSLSACAGGNRRCDHAA